MRNWLMRGWIMVEGLFSLVFLILGIVLFIKGGYKAHIFSGIGLDPHWRNASAESLLVVGVGYIALASLSIRAGRRHRRRRRIEQDRDRPQTRSISGPSRAKLT